MQDIIVATVDSVGSVEVLNDSATFTITVKSKNDSLTTAVKQSKEKVDVIVKALEELKEKGMQLESEIITSFNDFKLEHREGNERIHAGFQCVGTVSWTITVDERIDEFYKAALALDPNMSRPTFSIKERDKYKDEAIQMAANNVKEQLEKECGLLGVSPSDLKIQNWNFSYNGVLPSMNASTISNSKYYANGVGVSGLAYAAMGGLTGPGGYTSTLATKLGSIYQEPLDVKINPGSEVFRVAVRVNYIWNSK